MKPTVFEQEGDEALAKDDQDWQENPAEIEGEDNDEDDEENEEDDDDDESGSEGDDDDDDDDDRSLGFTRVSVSRRDLAPRGLSHTASLVLVVNGTGERKKRVRGPRPSRARRIPTHPEYSGQQREDAHRLT